MKLKLNFKALFVNLVLAITFGMLIGPAAGIDPLIISSVTFGLGTGLQFIFPNAFPKGVAMAGVYREIWTGEMVEGFKPEIEASFLGQLPDYSQYVQGSKNGENEVIHLVDIGADPEVLINNTSYPIGTESLTDTDLPYSLDKFQTKATKVTDDELYAISYDKIASVNKRHREAILAKKYGKAVHALAPAKALTATPIVSSSGAVAGGMKAVTVNDIIDLAGAMNDAGIPDDGNRVLVLNTRHVTDILKEVKNFYKDYANIGKAQELRALFYGFKTYVYHNNPLFFKDTADGDKLKKAAFDVVFNPATHLLSSVAFYAPDMFRAEGSTKMYYDEPDTQNQATFINYRHYYLAAPKKERAIAALVSVKS